MIYLILDFLKFIIFIIVLDLGFSWAFTRVNDSEVGKHNVCLNGKPLTFY
jgi:hypothetical protein